MNKPYPAGIAPRYQQLKSHLSDRIGSGVLRPGDRLPSEQELARLFAVSRMTATRAFNELEAEGVIVRSQGVGSFVAIPRVETAALQIHDISAEIQASNRAYRCKPLLIERARGVHVNALLGLPNNHVHFRTCLLHHADGVPVQIEDRFVNPVFAPNYLDNDFAKITPYKALMSLASLQAAEHVFEAALPSARQAEWLQVQSDEPCVVLRRRTWSRDVVASIAILTSPTSRYRYAGDLGTRPASTGKLAPL